MKRELYTEIKDFLRRLIKGTEWEGHLYCVGGCVRDDIMGAEIKDIDLCVSLPQGGIRFATWLQEEGHTLRKVTIYPSYGTAMLHLKEFPNVELEFVQTRKEKYVDCTCRNPETVFGSIEDDCLRRDLTINALYCNISTDEVVDITGHGVEDIKNCVIRTPADPDITYDDDPLRILRCIRFASRYDWEIEHNTYEGLLRNVNRLNIISKERVRDELDKMLTSAHPVMAMELLRKTGAMHYVIPEFEATYAMTQNEFHFGSVWEHTMAALEAIDSDTLLLRMAILLHDIGKPRSRTCIDGKVRFIDHENVGAEMVVEILHRLRYSSSFCSKVAFLVKHHMSCKSYGAKAEGLTDKRLRRLQYETQTIERFMDLMKVMDADNNAHAIGKCLPEQTAHIIARTEAMIAEGSAMFGYHLPITGKDVMRIKGIEQGKEVKEYLEYLLKVVFAESKPSKEQLLKHLADYSKHQQKPRESFGHR